MKSDNGQEHGVSFDAARERFEQWRNGGARSRIPDELWALAIQVARRDGVNRTAQALHLDGGKLKRLLVAADSSDTPRRVAPTFVELVAQQTTGTRDCMVELQDPRGTTMRIQFHGVTMAELAELSRALLNGLA